MPFADAYSKTRVLVTGDTGFKGSWLAFWLAELGAQVTGLALPPEHAKGPFVAGRLNELIRHTDGDIRDLALVDHALASADPQLVFHLAAQPLVRRAYADPVGTTAVNVLGTVHLLDALRRRGKPCAVVVVTSDKCYDVAGRRVRCREGDPLGGHDPYSATKACAEIMTEAYRRSFFAASTGIRVATARAGNVFGPGDWAEDRIVPDIVRALVAGRSVEVRNPASVRPWQHVLDPLSGYLLLGSRLLSTDAASFTDSWNFGPAEAGDRTVQELVDVFLAAWGSGSWKAHPSPGAPAEAPYLALDIHRAMENLKWGPVWDFHASVKRTAVGYRAMLSAGDDAERVRSFLRAEIGSYAVDACAARISWAQT